MRRAGRIAFRGVLGLLLAVGIFAAVERAISVRSADPAALDGRHLEGVVALSNLATGSAEYDRLAREIPLSSRNLNDRPHATFGHVVAGALFFVLVPLQFSRRLRSRHPAVHRWNGRAILVLVAASGLAGVYLGLAQPYGGAWESAAVSLFGALFLVSATLGYRAIRRRDIARHREWMIRMFAIGIGISVIRIFGMASLFAFGTQSINPRGFALSMWAGWLLAMAVAELWILRTRTRRSVESNIALQPL